MKFRNYYECSKCECQWEDDWASMCNDECPGCGQTDIEPYESKELDTDDYSN